jgi:hypothetical protein
VLLAVTVALAVLAGQVNQRAEADLLHRQVAQAATLLTTQVAVLTSQLGDAGQVAAATHADPGAFERFAAARLSRLPGTSLSLWRTGADRQAERLALSGPRPVGAARPDFDSFLAAVPEDGGLVAIGILPGEPARVGYALRSPEAAGMVVYAETPLPPHRRVRVPPTADQAFGGLDFAVYLGRGTSEEQLLYATGPMPIGDDTARATASVGHTAITVVGTSSTRLTGWLSSTLPWLVLAVGTLLSAAAGATVAMMGRRRAQAEELAAENDRLYREQRGIAGTLQQALLPEVPTIAGIDVAARYRAGGAGLEVGGDWFDVIDRGPDGCVFVVGDISGRGLPAATTMAELRFAVRAYLAQGDRIEDVLAKIRRLLDVHTDHQFATVLIGELDLPDHRLRLVSAGHFPPLLLTDGEASPLEVPVAPPVGLPLPRPPAAAEYTLPAGGTLLAFTDGLVERRREAIDTGLDRLRTASSALEGQPLGRGLDGLLESLTADAPGDDTVLLGLRWTGPPGAAGQPSAAAASRPER